MVTDERAMSEEDAICVVNGQSTASLQRIVLWWHVVVSSSNMPVCQTKYKWLFGQFQCTQKQRRGKESIVLITDIFTYSVMIEYEFSHLPSKLSQYQHAVQPKLHTTHGLCKVMHIKSKAFFFWKYLLRWNFSARYSPTVKGLDCRCWWRWWVVSLSTLFHSRDVLGCELWNEVEERKWKMSVEK